MNDPVASTMTSVTLGAKVNPCAFEIIRVTRDNQVQEATSVVRCSSK